jgi:hypothetical protein
MRFDPQDSLGVHIDIHFLEHRSRQLGTFFQRCCILHLLKRLQELPYTHQMLATGIDQAGQGGIQCP